MSTVLSHDAFHSSVGFAFDELVLREQLSQMPADSLVRILKSIPTPLLEQALGARQPAAERRAEPRRKVLRGARVMSGGRTLLDVQVRDISAGGCRIWCRTPEEVPDRFVIRIVGIPGDKPCEVRWRSGEELGLRF